jgi:hypothetical protein
MVKGEEREVGELFFIRSASLIKVGLIQDVAKSIFALYQDQNFGRSANGFFVFLRIEPC